MKSLRALSLMTATAKLISGLIRGNLELCTHTTILLAA